MKKNQFIEIVKGFLTGGDDNPDIQEKYHEARINLVASMAFNSAIYQVFYRQLDEKDLYTRNYNVDVNYDGENDEYYSDLPAPIVQLPKNSGIHKIEPVGERRSFDPINRLSEDIFTGLGFAGLSKDPSYYLEAKRVVYQYYDWKHKHIKKVRMALVLPLEAYEDDDELVIPAGKEDVILDFVDQHMAKQLPSDDSPNLNESQL